MEQERLSVVTDVELGLSFERMERGRRGDKPWLADTLWASAEAGQFAAPSLQPREKLPTNTVLGPALALELPIFDQNQAQIAKAEFLYEAANAQRDALQLEVAQETRAAVRLGIGADADERTVEILMTPADPPAWARPGVSAQLEIVSDGGAIELAIPLSATIRDGLRTLFFRRDPGNPNQVIRVEADLGANDGAWVVVESGVKEGDEVVLDGVYQLMLASSGASPKGGHFHADGTFHEGEH